MIGATTRATDVRISRGFRIEISPDELTVTESRPIAIRFAIYLGYFGLICFIFIRPFLHNRTVILFVIALATIRFLSLGTHNLRCTVNNLEVIDTVRGKIKKTRTYPLADVKRIRFGPVALFGFITGLIFDAAGKPARVLFGLRCVEARMILDEFQRLGFDVQRDPGMPMMVEMEDSRRKSWLWRWLTF